MPVSKTQRSHRGDAAGPGGAGQRLEPAPAPAPLALCAFTLGAWALPKGRVSRGAVAALGHAALEANEGDETRKHSTNEKGEK